MSSHNTFKIESDIPLLEEDPEEEEYVDDDEDPEVPGKRGRKPRCKSNDLHRWEKISDSEDQCTKCLDVFPCRNEEKCWHFDCWEARGKVHPWLVPESSPTDTRSSS